jgi:hypothetical protein
VLDEALTERAAAERDLRQAVGSADLGRRLIGEVLARARAEHRLLRGLPDHGVPAHECESRVPRPHGHRKVKGRDDATDAKRLPDLSHAMSRALGDDRRAVQLTRQTDREIAHVDHLLHLAEGLAADLARLKNNKLGKIGLMAAQEHAQHPHELDSNRCRRDTPHPERIVRARHDIVQSLSITSSYESQRPPVIGVRAGTLPSPGPTAPNRSNTCAAVRITCSVLGRTFMNRCTHRRWTGRGRSASACARPRTQSPAILP